MNMYNRSFYNNDERFFWMPFILGGLSGAAIGSVVSRPRPVYINGYQNPMPYFYNSPGYYSQGYNYYY